MERYLGDCNQSKLLWKTPSVPPPVGRHPGLTVMNTGVQCYKKFLSLHSQLVGYFSIVQACVPRPRVLRLYKSQPPLTSILDMKHYSFLSLSFQLGFSLSTIKCYQMAALWPCQSLLQDWLLFEYLIFYLFYLYWPKATKASIVIIFLHPVPRCKLKCRFYKSNWRRRQNFQIIKSFHIQLKLVKILFVLCHYIWNKLWKTRLQHLFT